MKISAVLTYQLEIKTSVFVFGTMIYGKIKCMMEDLPQKSNLVIVIDNNDSGTFRPVAIMIVAKAEINASGSFPISRRY